MKLGTCTEELIYGWQELSPTFLWKGPGAFANLVCSRAFPHLFVERALLTFAFYLSFCFALPLRTAFGLTCLAICLLTLCTRFISRKLRWEQSELFTFACSSHVLSQCEVKDGMAVSLLEIFEKNKVAIPAYMRNSLIFIVYPNSGVGWFDHFSSDWPGSQPMMQPYSPHWDPQDGA